MLPPSFLAFEIFYLFFSPRNKQEGHGLALVLQVLGMAAGVGIMLVIALYETEMKILFGGEGHSH